MLSRSMPRQLGSLSPLLININVSMLLQVAATDLGRSALNQVCQLKAHPKQMLATNTSR